MSSWKLTHEQREAAVREVLAGARQIDVARKYGVSQAAVCGWLQARRIPPASLRKKKPSTIDAIRNALPMLSIAELREVQRTAGEILQEIGAA